MTLSAVGGSADDSYLHDSYILPALNSLFHIHASDGNTILRHYLLLHTTEIVQTSQKIKKFWKDNQLYKPELVFSNRKSGHNIHINPLPKSHNTEVFLKTMNFCVYNNLLQWIFRAFTVSSWHSVATNVEILISCWKLLTVTSWYSNVTSSLQLYK